MNDTLTFGANADDPTALVDLVVTAEEYKTALQLANQPYHRCGDALREPESSDFRLTMYTKYNVQSGVCYRLVKGQTA